MKAILAAIAIFCLGAALPALAADEESPFVVDKRTFKKQFKTIALSPVDADSRLKMPDAVAAMLEDEVTRHLEKRGYTVIPTSVLRSIRDTMENQVGGLVSPESGRVDPKKLQAVRSHAFRELWFRHQFDAIATIKVTVSRAQFANDRAEWDGVKQSIEHEGRNRKYAGDIVSSSVSFAVYDHTNKLMYVSYGGLEVLQMRDEAQLIPIPAERYFSDEKRVRKAAKVAMSPI